MAKVDDGRDAFSSLREVLAELYPGVQDAQRVGMDAGLNIARVAFDLRPINTWHNILVEASKQGRLDQLLAVAKREYGEYPPFVDALKRTEVLPGSEETVRLSQDADPPSTVQNGESTAVNWAARGTVIHLADDSKGRRVPAWFYPAGVISGLLTLLVFVGLVAAHLFGNQVSCDSRFLPLVVLALGAAFTASFLGGWATVEGKVPFLASSSPFRISAGGGITVLILVLLLGNWIYLSPDCPDAPSASGTTERGESVGAVTSVGSTPGNRTGPPQPLPTACLEQYFADVIRRGRSYEDMLIPTEEGADVVGPLGLLVGLRGAEVAALKFDFLPDEPLENSRFDFISVVDMECNEIEYANKAQPGIFPMFNWHSINFWVDGQAYELSFNWDGELIRFLLNRDPLLDDANVLAASNSALSWEAQQALILLDSLSSYEGPQGEKAGNFHQYSWVIDQLAAWDLGEPANALVRQLQEMLTEVPESKVGGGWDMMISEEMQAILTSLRALLIRQ